MEGGRTSPFATLAVIFDFDDTLVPDSTGELLRAHGISPQDFYLKDVKALVETGYEPTHAYLNRLLNAIGEGKPLGPIKNSDLRDFGKGLNTKFFPGLPEMFDELRAIVREFKDIAIEFHVISGGIQEIIEGTKLATDWGFSAIYGCQLAGDTEDGILRYIKRAITFTEKTRFIFEINKGFSPAQVLKSPYLVNKDKHYNMRRVPFANMIYVGDGQTDIPCFSLVRKGIGEPDGGGITFGVFDPASEMSAKQTLLEHLKPGRVISSHAPNYMRDRELGSVIRAAVRTRCSEIKLREEEP